jgi:hypothetical protein
MLNSLNHFKIRYFLNHFLTQSSKKFRLSLRIFFLLATVAPPLYAQDFNTLLNELSETDQLESEMADSKNKKEKDVILESPSFPEAASPPEEDLFATEKNIVTNGITLQGLDKQTARVFIIDAPVGQTIEFGTLKIVVKRCEKTPLEDRQESMAFMVISEEKAKSPPQKLFSGWMFSSSPSLSFLDHPLYDVWIKDCKNLE